MRRIWVVAALLVALHGTAAADALRTVIDRIDLEPAMVTGQRLTIYLSAITREGSVVELERQAIKATAGGEIRAPLVVGRYAQTQSDTAIAIVVQGSLEYNEVLPVIAETLGTHILPTLNDRTQVALLTYGEATSATRMMSVKAARGKIGGLIGDGTAGNPVLLDTLDRALLLLKKVKTNPPNRPVRKMIILIGDGRDSSGELPPEKPKAPPPPPPPKTDAPKGGAGSAAAPPAPAKVEPPKFVRRETADREKVKKLGDRALREGVRIHSFAYSPTNQRRPLLLLGELSKRSLGTFRWVESGKSESWTPKMKQLAHEIERQYVLTYFLPPDAEVAGKKVKITTSGRIDSLSNELKIPNLGCGGEACEGYCADEKCVIPKKPERRGFFGWIFMLAGTAVAILVLLSLIGFVISKVQARKIPLPPGVSPDLVKKPGSIPPGARPATGPPPSIPAPAQPPAPVTSGPRLLVLTGPRAGQTFACKHGFTIGKAEGCDLLIDDGYTSSHHAQIHMDQANNCRVFDLNSTNGTFSNGVRITNYHLEHGASIRVGSTEIRFLSQ